jgi:hypothetical protein
VQKLTLDADSIEVSSFQPDPATAALYSPQRPTTDPTEATHCYVCPVYPQPGF